MKLKCYKTQIVTKLKMGQNSNLDKTPIFENLGNFRLTNFRQRLVDQQSSLFNAEYLRTHISDQFSWLVDCLTTKKIAEFSWCTVPDHKIISLVYTWLTTISSHMRSHMRRVSLDDHNQSLLIHNNRGQLPDMQCCNWPVSIVGLVLLVIEVDFRNMIYLYKV